jgi:signal transduction histidine kinase
VLDSLTRLASGHKITRTLADSVLAKWEMKIGSAYMRQGKADSCIVHQRRSIAVLEAMEPGERPHSWWNNRLLAWKFLGKAHQTKGDGPAALEAYRRYYEDAVQLNWSMDQAAALDYMGSVHASMLDHGRAIRLHREAISILEKSTGVGPDLGIAYGNLARALAKTGRTDSALYYMRKALPRLTKDGHPMNFAEFYLALAEFHLEVDELDSADRYLALADPILRKWDHKPSIGQFKLIQGQLDRKRNNLTTAQQRLTEAVAIAGEVGHQGGLASAERSLSSVLAARGDSIGGATDLVRSADSALMAHLNLEKVRIMAARDAEFQRYRDSLLAAERLRNEKARSDRLLYGLIIAVALAALLIHLVLRLRARGRALRSKHTELLTMQQRLMESERRREAEKVRTNIARDVHDQLGSDLTKLVLLSTEARELAQSDVRAVPALADDIERIASEANRSLSDIVWSIDPHHDSIAGLTERVRAHAERMLKWCKVEHTMDCVYDGPDRALDPAAKRDIYLIFREALNNAIKYAGAGHIRVLFRTSATRAEFEVEDNGVGMDADRGVGYGMGNMQVRAQRLGGTLHVRSGAGTGTLLTFAVMFPAEPHA